MPVLHRLPDAVAAALFASGFAYVGRTLSLGLYAAAFEIMRAFAVEDALESRQLLDRVRMLGGFISVAAGLWLYWRWHRPDHRLRAPGTANAVRRWIARTAIAAGAVCLAANISYGETPETLILIALLALAAGCVFAARFYGGSALRTLAVTPIVAICTALLIWVSLAFDKMLFEPYRNLGEGRFVWIKIAFPDETPRPEYKSISVRLRTPSGTVNGFAIPWEREQDKTILPLRVDFTEKTADREVIVTLPGRDPIALKMPFARNPKPMRSYSAPLDAGNGLTYRYRVN